MCSMPFESGECVDISDFVTTTLDENVNVNLDANIDSYGVDGEQDNYHPPIKLRVTKVNHADASLEQGIYTVRQIQDCSIDTRGCTGKGDHFVSSSTDILYPSTNGPNTSDSSEEDEIITANKPEISELLMLPTKTVTDTSQYFRHFKNNYHTQAQSSYAKNPPPELEKVLVKMEPMNENEHSFEDEAKIDKSKKMKKQNPEAEFADLNLKYHFTCQICSTTFSDPAQVPQHMADHPDVGTYQCKTCERVFQNIEELRVHMFCHLKKPQFRCELCARSFIYSTSLNMHNKRWHMDKKPYMCDICGKSFAVRMDLISHMSTHMAKFTKCPHCDNTYKTMRHLKLHIKTHFPSEMDHVQYPCDVCNKIFQTPKYLFQHKRVHEEKQHECQYCGKKLSTSYSLIVHIRSHEGVKPFECSQCEKAFVDKGKLLRHMKSHLDEKQYMCPVCSKGFVQSQYLKQHMDTHETERSYPCKMCGKSFKSMNSVWAHMRKHTQATKYECQFCGKTCYRADHLRSHLSSHTGVKEFHCETCLVTFTRSQDLTEHRRIHMDERPFSCEPCNKAFTDLAQLGIHQADPAHKQRYIEVYGAPEENSENSETDWSNEMEHTAAQISSSLEAIPNLDPLGII